MWSLHYTSTFTAALPFALEELSGHGISEDQDDSPYGNTDLFEGYCYH